MKRPGLTIGSWALYDLANTIVSAIVITAYFPLYVTKLAGANWPLGLVTTSSMIFAGLLVPFLGALSDHTGKTKVYLIRATLACVICVCLLSFFKLVPALLLLFFLSCFFFHTSLVFYNSLLPVVASPRNQGRVSGLGVGLGYLGAVLALPVAHFFDSQFGRSSVFWLAGVFFLIFALPLIKWVPERTVEAPVPFSWKLWKKEWIKVIGLLEMLPSMPHLLLFFAGNFFVVDALNSMILWFLVYAREVFGPDQKELIRLLITVNISAFLFGLLTGWLTDRIGSMRTLLIAAAALTLTLIDIPFAANFKTFSWICILGGSFAIAGVWTAGRKALIELAPARLLGEYFGLYGLTTKVSVLGSLFFSITADVAGFKSAIWLLVFPATLGWIFLMGSAYLTQKNRL